MIPANPDASAEDMEDAMDLRGPLPPHVTSQFTVFNRCVISVIDNLPEASTHPTLLQDLSAGILDFGGAYRHNLDDMAAITHVVPLSGSLDEQFQRLVASQPRNIPVVYWQWIMDCINCRRYLSPRMYSIALPLIPRSGPPASIPSNESVPHGTWYTTKDLMPLTKPVFSKRTVYLHSDIPATQATQLSELIVNNGGRVLFDWSDVHSRDQPPADMHVFRYAQSAQYLEAVQLDLPIASLYWLLDVLRLQEWTDPLDSLLHYPFPHRRPGSISHAALCLTEFHGRDREYCKGLIHVLGAQYLSDMNRETTHLIAAKPSGRKYTVATSDEWKKVHTVNYTWLEDSVRHGQLQDTLTPMYTFFVANAPSIPGPVVGASRTPKWVVDRIVEEARAYVERAQAKRQRELESLLEAAGTDAPRAGGTGDEVSERRAKERGLAQVHRQYTVLQSMSKEERSQVEKTWEMGDDEFEAPEDLEATQPQAGIMAPEHDRVVIDLTIDETPDPRPRRSKRARGNSTSPPRRSGRKPSTQSPLARPMPSSNSPTPRQPTAPPSTHDQPGRSRVAVPRVMVSRIDIPNDLGHQLDMAGISIAHANAPIVGATHLVTNKATYAERFLLGMTTAQFIVHSAWLTESAAVGYPLDEGRFLLRDAAFEAEMGKTVAAAMDQIQSSSLLSGVGLCIVPNKDKSALGVDMAKRLAEALRATHVPLADLDVIGVGEQPRLPLVLVVEPKEDDLLAHYPHIYHWVVDEMGRVEQGQPNRGVWMYGLDYFTWSIRSGTSFQTPSDRVVFWALQEAM